MSRSLGNEDIIFCRQAAVDLLLIMSYLQNIMSNSEAPNLLLGQDIYWNQCYSLPGRMGVARASTKVRQYVPLIFTA